MSNAEKDELIEQLLAEDPTTTIGEYLDTVRPRRSIAGAVEVVRPKSLLEFSWPGVLKSTG